MKSEFTDAQLFSMFNVNINPDKEGEFIPLWEVKKNGIIENLLENDETCCLANIHDNPIERQKRINLYKERAKNKLDIFSGEPFKKIA